MICLTEVWLVWWFKELSLRRTAFSFKWFQRYNFYGHTGSAVLSTTTEGFEKQMIINSNNLQHKVQRFFHNDRRIWKTDGHNFHTFTEGFENCGLRCKRHFLFPPSFIKPFYSNIFFPILLLHSHSLKSFQIFAKIEISY